MAINIDTSTIKNITEYPNSFKRQGAFPLERYSVFNTLTEAEAYAKSNSIAYVGQIITVVDAGGTSIYKINNEAGDLVRVDSLAGEAGSVIVEKLETATAGYLASYVVKQGGSKVGATIDIPKDFLVKSATTGKATAEDVAEGGKLFGKGFAVGDTYLDFVINTKDNDGTVEHMYVNASALVDVYTGKDGTTVNVTVGDDNGIAAEVKDGSLSETKFDDALKTKLANLRANINTVSVDLGTEQTRAKNAEEAIADTLNKVSSDYLKSEVKNELTGLIDNAKSEALTAVSNLRTELYTGDNGLSAKLHKEVSDAAAAAKNDAVSVLADAKAYTNEVSGALSTDYVGKIKVVSDKLTALTSNLDTNYLKSEVANSPTSADMLMKRTEVEAKINALDVATTELVAGKTIKTIGEQDGKISVETQDIQITKSQVTDLTSDLNTINTAIGGLTAISASQDGKIKTLETSVGTLMADESTSGSVKAQVKAEADRAKGVESALAATLSTVSSDYLKSEVETDLQGKIDKINTALTGDGGYDSRIIANANAISTLNGDASIEGSVDKKIKDSLAGLANAMHFRGVVTRGEGQNTDQAAIDAQITNPIDGDVVVVTDSSKEYVYDGTNKKWIELGDETLYATNAKLTAEAEARAAADTFLSGKISVLIGTGDGSVSKTLADAKAYADGISTTLSGDYDKKIAAEAKRAGDAEKVLSSAVDNKVLIDGISATQLKVSHISDTEFHQKVVDGTLDKNEIYVVSSQNINAFDERITNVKAPELSSDAATKSYVDETVKGSQSKLDTLSTYTHALSVSQLVWDIDVINCGTAK